MRRRNYWRGIDSLYHAWLLKNFDEIQPGFDLVRFEAKYPSYLEYGDLDVTVEGLDAIREGMSKYIVSSPELGDRDDTALKKDVGLREKRTYATRNADENEEEDDICSQNYKRPTPEPAVDVDRSNGKLYY